jgi:Flp pilus assembly pilin Flp
MNRILTRLHLGATEAAGSVQRRLNAGRRGAGFFEYALLALIAVALMVVVYNAFKNQINDLFGTIDKGIDTENPTIGN